MLTDFRFFVCFSLTFTMISYHGTGLILLGFIFLFFYSLYIVNVVSKYVYLMTATGIKLTTT